MKRHSLLTATLAGIFVFVNIQLLWMAPVGATPLGTFSDVAHQVTQNLPDKLPDMSSINQNLTDLRNSERVSNIIDKVEGSRQAATRIGGQLTQATITTGREASSTALQYGKEWGGAALETGTASGEQVLSTSAALGQKGLDMGQATFQSAAQISRSAKDGAVLLIGQGATATTYAMKDLAAEASEAFKKSAEPYLMGALEEINIAALLPVVEAFKAQNPNLDFKSLAHKFIGDKRNSNLRKDNWQDVAISLTEMVYEIAGVYGLPLQAPERKDEVIKITSLGLGSAFAAAQFADVAGFAAGFAPVPSNYITMGKGGTHALAKAVMFWRVGEAACDYYESLAKLGD